MILYRLCKKEFAGDLSGRGAEINGNRWNSKGCPAVYACANISLCVAEIAVHEEAAEAPQDYVLVALEIGNPGEPALVNEEQLPADWKEQEKPDVTQKIGDHFIKECKQLVLQVPSAVVQGEYNFLLNPQHPQFCTVRIKSKEPFHFDERLFNKQPA